ncbi:hypothetical protein CA85_20730 [Allorhodopirellula solitaria]|uniref:Uncharacterized protein n=1 Tax=Allorhodopirellula solitaria TaxID=2527987 RepID=A0A5C5XWD6_9BACT|nr:hypothetical protein CA85_20730 [Allorhodopirellula solitaria]
MELGDTALCFVWWFSFVEDPTESTIILDGRTDNGQGAEQVNESKSPKCHGCCQTRPEFSLPVYWMVVKRKIAVPLNRLSWFCKLYHRGG